MLVRGKIFWWLREQRVVWWVGTVMRDFHWLPSLRLVLHVVFLVCIWVWYDVHSPSKFVMFLSFIQSLRLELFGRYALEHSLLCWHLGRWRRFAEYHAWKMTSTHGHSVSGFHESERLLTDGGCLQRRRDVRCETRMKRALLFIGL